MQARVGAIVFCALPAQLVPNSALHAELAAAEDPTIKQRRSDRMITQQRKGARSGSGATLFSSAIAVTSRDSAQDIAVLGESAVVPQGALPPNNGFKPSRQPNVAFGFSAPCSIITPLASTAGWRPA